LVAFELYDQQQPLKITIDLFPDQNLEELKQRMEEKAKEQPKKNLANGFIGWLSKSFTETMCEVLSVSLEKKAGELSKKEIQQMVQWLKAIPLHAVARGAGDEFVTAGGVPLQEVNPSTMESMLCPGLFFAGEILDVDGFTGGFNLQASWATGHLAGISAAQEKAST
jgi:predicted Rossmann fold flavoprotein